MLKSKSSHRSATRRSPPLGPVTHNDKRTTRRAKMLKTAKRQLTIRGSGPPSQTSHFMISPITQTLESFIEATPPLRTPERFELPTGEAKSTSELRASFTNYFKSQGHVHLPSASVVPLTDPSLLFTSAGMVPFKNIFLGIEQPPNQATRVTTAQRCVRAGGKHNDLDNVGYTSRHHTYFEMLGNFSFGDYFKEEAMYFAWDYLTNTLKLPKSKLMVSVFDTDDDAAQLWAKISGFSEEKGTIRRMGAEDNFWQMGDTGPCGPCSEIYFDQGKEIDGERFLEIWNLVFMQFNRQENGELQELGKKCVDTGMGLERLASVMQGVHNNFDNDAFLPLINKIGASAQFHNGWRTVESPHGIVDHHGDVVNQEPVQNGTSAENAQKPQKSPQTSSLDLSSTSLSHHQRLTATRVVADHLRSILAMLFDGIQPGSSGRGYVLRRIIRRACRYGLDLGYNAPFMYQYVDDVLQEMDKAIPGIFAVRRQLKADLFQEEKIFSASLSRGIKIIKDYISKEIEAGVEPGVRIGVEVGWEDQDKSGQKDQNQGRAKKQFPVDLAFSLYDAHGFPIDLTELCVQEYGWELDTQTVERLLENRKQQSRELAKMFSKNSQNGQTEIQLTQKTMDTVFDLWRSDGLSSEFVGYERTFVPKARVLDIKPLGPMVRTIPDHQNQENNCQNDPTQAQSSPQVPPSLGKRQVLLALNECPFYPTGGGQMSDTGNVTVRIPKMILPPSLQTKTLNDFEVIVIGITNAVKDPKGNTILLSGEFDEHPLLDSETILEMIRQNEAASQSGQNQHNFQNFLQNHSQFSDEFQNSTSQNDPSSSSPASSPFQRLFITASVDADTREQTSIHHTATHLLQAALQKVLGSPVSEVGDHHESSNHASSTNEDPCASATVKQAGSQVEYKNLRFDFGFSRPLTPSEVNAVEDRINAIALRRIPVDIAEMSFDKAKGLGAMALFGEKYGSEVRVVSIPESHTHQHHHHKRRMNSHLVENLENHEAGLNSQRAKGENNQTTDGKNSFFSVELCGGTHVDNTGDCYPFVILSESGVSSGTRRIEAIAGPMAAQHLAEQHRALKILKHDQILRLHHLAETDEIISNVIKLKTKADGAAMKVKELEKEKLAMLSGPQNNTSLAQSLQDVNPLLSSFWHQPNGVSLSIVVPQIQEGTNDHGELNNRAPIVMLYSVKPFLSTDHSVYRKFTENLVQQQSEKHAKFLMAHACHTHQSIAHVFIGDENGKAMIYSNIPTSCTKKGGDNSIISGHGGKHLTSNEVWKNINDILAGSKGGGNMTLAQGTFEFSQGTCEIGDGGVAQDLMRGAQSTPEDRLKGLADALAPLLTKDCKF